MPPIELPEHAQTIDAMTHVGGSAVAPRERRKVCTTSRHHRGDHFSCF
jgi:hypothetical protein